MTSAFKIDQLVYENRQHSLGRIVCSKDYSKSLLAQTENEEVEGIQSDEEKTTIDSADPKSRSATKKKVTFACGKNLVHIREIPARPKTPIWSGSEESGSDSDESTSDSDGSRSQDEAESVDQLTSDLANRCSIKSGSTTYANNQTISKNGVNSVNMKRSLHRSPQKVKTGRDMSTPSNHSIVKSAFLQGGTQRRKPFIPFSVTSRRYAESNKSLKPQTQKGNAVRPHTTNSYMLRMMSGASAPKLSMSYRMRQSEDDSNLLSKRKSLQQGSLTNIPPQNDRYSRVGDTITNSGEERSKFYAWQVANGAPLMTTPGIAPLYSEHVTLTKL